MVTPYLSRLQRAPTAPGALRPRQRARFEPPAPAPIDGFTALFGPPPPSELGTSAEAAAPARTAPDDGPAQEPSPPAGAPPASPGKSSAAVDDLAAARTDPAVTPTVPAARPPGPATGETSDRHELAGGADGPARSAAPRPQSRPQPPPSTQVRPHGVDPTGASQGPLSPKPAGDRSNPSAPQADLSPAQTRVDHPVRVGHPASPSGSSSRPVPAVPASRLRRAPTAPTSAQAVTEPSPSAALSRDHPLASPAPGPAPIAATAALAPPLPASAERAIGTRVPAPRPVPLPAPRAAEPRTEVTVTIGRIEVRAPAAEAAPAPPGRSGPRRRPPSLDDYLRARARGRAG
jgi:hypothetical protein